MRLIDADKLIRSINSIPVLTGLGPQPVITIADVKELINAIPTASDWISVKEKLPEKNGRYLVLDENGEVYSAEYEKNRPNSEWTDDYEGYIDMTVTHWMLLPVGPKEDDWV